MGLSSVDSVGGRRLKIGVDIDGVIADIVECILPLLARECGRDVVQDDITCYGFGEALGIPEDRVRALMEELVANGYYDVAPIVRGAAEAMRRLARHEFWLVTARPDQVREATLRWLSRHGVRYHTLVFAPVHRKALRTDGFDLFVEDNLDTARALRDEGIPVLLFDRPWNRAKDLPLGVVRVGGWQDISAFVEREACALPR